MKRLLLISNSISYGKGYLDHCEDAIMNFLGEIRSLLFIPYALYDLDNYFSTVEKRFGKMGIKTSPIHNADPLEAIKKAKGFFVGGGNTFRLLKKMNDSELIKPMRDAVLNGIPYIGISAGINLASLTIKTTNDMPIVFPGSLDALNLISFQINPHYIDPDPSSTHKGETREQRIKEFHEENDTPVIGLYEGSWIRAENDSITIEGKKGAKLFRKGEKPILLKNGPIVL